MFYIVNWCFFIVYKLFLCDNEFKNNKKKDDIKSVEINLGFFLLWDFLCNFYNYKLYFKNLSVLLKYIYWMRRGEKWVM